MAINRKIDLAATTLVFNEIQPEGYKWNGENKHYIGDCALKNLAEKICESILTHYSLS